MKARMQPPAPRSPVRRFLRLRAALAAAMVLATVLVGCDTVLWFRLEREMDHRLDRFIRTARAEGWRFSARAGSRGGWPLSATLVLQQPSLRYPAPDPGGADALAWSGEAVVLSLSPWRPARATVLAVGTQDLSVVPNGGLPMPLRFWGARIALLLPEAGRAGRVALEADALHVALPGAGPDDVVELAGAAGALRWPADRKAASAALSLSLSLREVALPARLGRRQGRVVQDARLDASLDGPPVPWLRPGDAIRLGEASLDWDGDRAALSGTILLAADGIPFGTLSLSVDDAGRMVSKLRDTGLLSPGAAVVAQAVAGLVGAAAPGTPLHLPLTLHGGLLSLGEIPLLRIPGLR